jgi:hypothetical protein
MDTYTPCQKVEHLSTVANFKKFIKPHLKPFKGIQKFRSFIIRKLDDIPQIFCKVNTLQETELLSSGRSGGINSDSYCNSLILISNFLDDTFCGLVILDDIPALQSKLANMAVFFPAAKRKVVPLASIDSKLITMPRIWSEYKKEAGKRAMKSHKIPDELQETVEEKSDDESSDLNSDRNYISDVSDVVSESDSESSSDEDADGKSAPIIKYFGSSVGNYNYLN